LCASAAVACVLCLGLAAPALAAPQVRLIGGIPTLLAAGESVKVSGRVLHGPRAARIVLEDRPAGRTWRVARRGSVRAGVFRLLWTPPAGAALKLRFTLRAGGRVLARSTTLELRVGPAPRFCPTPAAPEASSVPAGDGWITGGLYDEGGPAPGIFACHSGPYSVSAVNEAGETTLTQQVGGTGYALILPAGSYELEANEQSCFSEAAVTVQPDRGSALNVICQVP
jgi:hypothetical protein